MRRSLRVIVVILGACWTLSGFARAELTAQQREELVRLINDFRAVEFAARQEAVEKVVAMGLDAASVLVETHAGTKDPEVKLRCEMALRKLNEKHNRLIFLWDSAYGEGTANPLLLGGVQGGIELQGKARRLESGELELTEGSCAARNVDAALLKACKETNALTVEAILVSANLTQGGPSRIVTFSTDTGQRDFTLGQEKDELVFRLRTPATGENGSSPQTTVCKIEAGKRYHVMVTYTPGKLQGYVDGELVLEGQITGDFSNWTEQRLGFGDEFGGERDWHGRLGYAAIYARPLSADEAKEHFKGLGDRISDE